MYYLLTGKFPFREATAEKTLEAIRTAEVKYDNAVWKGYNPEAKNLVMSLLDRNTARRIKAPEALNHRWIEKVCLLDGKRETEDIINSLRNLKNLRLLSTFQKAVLIYIASQFSDPKEEEKYSKIFELIDKDKDGKVTQADLYAAFLSVYKDKFRANIDSAIAIKRNDFSGNGSIEYTGIVIYDP